MTERARCAYNIERRHKGRRYVYSRQQCKNAALPGHSYCRVHAPPGTVPPPTCVDCGAVIVPTRCCERCGSHDPRGRYKRGGAIVDERGHVRPLAAVAPFREVGGWLVRCRFEEGAPGFPLPGSVVTGRLPRWHPGQGC